MCVHFDECDMKYIYKYIQTFEIYLFITHFSIFSDKINRNVKMTMKTQVTKITNFATYQELSVINSSRVSRNFNDKLRGAAIVIDR